MRNGPEARRGGSQGQAPPQWCQERRSPYPWEQDGLDHVRRLLPRAEPYRAWATFSFTSSTGRVHECDLLVAAPNGLHLVELKGHPGRVVNRAGTWKVYDGTSTRPRHLRNPLHLTDLKSKELKSRLDWAAKELGKKTKVPRISASVFLSAPGLVSELDEQQNTSVYGRDEDCQGLPWIWRDLLARPPANRDRVTPEFSRDILPELLDTIDIRAATAHLRFDDEWELSHEVLDMGLTWEDRLAERTGIVREQGRVRIYLTERQADAERRESVTRAARREYQLLQGITHRGIAQAVQIRENQGGPAILFHHRASDLRLDSYLDLFDEQLTFETRLDMVRQLAEAVQYAHSRSLYHRALSARSVYVSTKDGKTGPVLRIIDWQAAARDFDTSGHTSLGRSSPEAEHLASATEAYLAPEFDAPYADPVDLDIFGLGALAYLLLTGQPPAPQRAALIDRLAKHGGLHPYAVSDGISDALDAVVFSATQADVAQRLDSADAFLKRLDSAERESLPDAVPVIADPLAVSPGQALDSDWTVERILGTGATARALLITHVGEDENGDPLLERRVLKVALDEAKAVRLLDEAEALRKVGGGMVVKLLAPPRQLGGRAVLDLEYAGGTDPESGTLGELLRAEGKLSYHYLERYGRDLFTALDQLQAQGVRHRDLKPDNFGVYRRADRSTQLMLFDFSLAKASELDVKAGTRAYLDPHLGTERRPRYDDHAERYAAAVTLHEMASGRRPVWGDGVTDPRTTNDATPTLAVDLFDPALRDELTAFFHRALHRDVNKRFDGFRQMEEAWRGVFTVADAASPVTTPGTVGLGEATLEETRNAHAEAAALDTPLDAAGLTPRAVSVAQSFDAVTVGDLLNVPLYRIAKARGAGALVRKELNRRHKQWTSALCQDNGPGPRAVADQGRLSVDDLAQLLTGYEGGRRGSKRGDVIRLTLGLPTEHGPPRPWPTQSEVADELGINQTSVSWHYRNALRAWAKEPRLQELRDELVRLVTDAGRIMTANELAAGLRTRFGSVDQDAERVAARALAVVRAGVDTEVDAGMAPGAPDGGPRLTVYRRGGRLLIALESLRGVEEPSASELADYAVRLGERADDLVSRDPLPGRGVVVRELRAVTPPEGLTALADTRLADLAAAMSENAAASPRVELYPRDLNLARAVRISQAAAGVRRDHGITMEDVLARVRARFPALALGRDLTHVVVEEALQQAGFPLEYDTTTRRFRPRATELPGFVTSSSTAMTRHERMRAAGIDPTAVVEAKLCSALERGGFLALTVRGVHVPGAAQAVATAYAGRLRPVNLDSEFLTAFQALVDERGQDWEKVRRLDARLAATGEISRGFASYVTAAWNRLRARLMEFAADDGVLFLHEATLLARYFDEGGHDLLTGVQNAARRPREAPHGLWLLCPADSALDAPRLGTRLVEVLGDSERVVLDSEFLAALRTGSAA
ncbi:BREX system serine/threonine kinase PglW [Actinoalloteichus sp. AHMU CJ021]|nr:BREX system serine/threonine kinase PglW [Actinoalloteichus caeruleus]AUS81915.1 BREX system serine/threonine kinase PglW [Actinoalloteichus sp. AHMU CJ021]